MHRQMVLSYRHLLLQHIPTLVPHHTKSRCWSTVDKMTSPPSHQLPVNDVQASGNCIFLPLVTTGMYGLVMGTLNMIDSIPTIIVKLRLKNYLIFIP